MEKSIHATEEQKNLIVQNVVSFHEVKEQSGGASLKALELSGEVNNLKRSNGKIVDSIAQLSALSEEVTANAHQASDLSNENVAQIKNAVRKVINIKDIIMGLEKYQGK